MFETTYQGISRTIKQIGRVKTGMMIRFKKQRVSFDYDGVLSTKRGKEQAIWQLKKGNDVYIVTARRTDQSKDVYKIADELGIEHSKVVFTNGEDKWTYLVKHEIDLHYDNNREQIRKIKQNTNIKTELWQ